MKHVIWILATLPFILPLATQAQQPPVIDRELLFGDPEISGAQISPDGKYIAFLKPLSKTRNIWVKKTQEPFSAAKPVTADTKRPIPAYFWSRDSKYILYVQDQDGDENYNVYAVDPAAQPPAGAQVPAARNLTDVKGARAFIYEVPRSDPDTIYVGLNDRDKAWHDLYRLKISTGSPALDCLLPGGGLRRGTLVEYLTSTTGSGAGTLALAAAREACREGRALVVLDCTTSYFYPPAAAAWGIDLAKLLVLRPVNEADALWALDQALRCPGVGAVWTEWDWIDMRDFRRLQLAAECGGTLGLLVRSARYRGRSPSRWPARPARAASPASTLRPSRPRWTGRCGGRPTCPTLTPPRVPEGEAAFEGRAGRWRRQASARSANVAMSGAVRSGVAVAGGVAPKPGRS